MIIHKKISPFDNAQKNFVTTHSNNNNNDIAT